MIKSHTSIILTSVLLGFIGIFVKLVGSSVPIMTVSFFRVFFGFLFLAVILLIFDRKAFRIKKGELAVYVIFGFLFAANFSMFNAAISVGPISNAYLISQSYVIFAGIFAYFFLKERITKQEIIASILGIVGIIIMNPLESGYVMGNMLALIEGISFGVIIVYMRYEEKGHSPTNVMWFLFFASLFLLPFPFIYGMGNFSQGVLWIALLGILCTGLAYYLLGYGLKRVQAEVASIIMLVIIPIVSITLAKLIVHEAFTAHMIVGGVLLITAGILLEYWK